MYTEQALNELWTRNGTKIYNVSDYIDVQTLEVLKVVHTGTATINVLRCADLIGILVAMHSLTSSSPHLKNVRKMF